MPSLAPSCRYGMMEWFHKSMNHCLNSATDTGHDRKKHGPVGGETRVKSVDHPAPALPFLTSVCLPMRKSDVLCFSRKAWRWYQSWGTQSRTWRRALRCAESCSVSWWASTAFLCRYLSRNPLAGSTLLENVTILKSRGARNVALNQHWMLGCFKSVATEDWEDFLTWSWGAARGWTTSSRVGWWFQWCRDWNTGKPNFTQSVSQAQSSESLTSQRLRTLSETHHLWYLQVSAPFTSSLMAAESLMSSMITTSGSSPPLSLSIWFATSERYSCSSCQMQRKRE